MRRQRHLRHLQVPCFGGGGDILPTELALVNRVERAEKVRLACQVKVKQDMAIRIPDEIFNIRKYNATVVSNDNVATFIKELVIKLDPGETIEFKAGAYIQIDIPEYEAEFKDFSVAEKYKSAWKQYNLLTLKARSDEPVNRAYSLANPPIETDTLIFTIRIATPPPGKEDSIPPGIGSSYAFNLKPGTALPSAVHMASFSPNPPSGRCASSAAAPAWRRFAAISASSCWRWKAGGASPSGTAPARGRRCFITMSFWIWRSGFDNFSYCVALSDPLARGRVAWGDRLHPSGGP
jgi:Na+-transporting NADH:ubiquinone oxidoreductase subunit F